MNTTMPKRERAGFYPKSLRQNIFVRYGAPFLITAIALLVWMLWPVMHTDPFAIFIAAVIVSASFFGFVPAVICAGLSVLTLEFVVFPRTPIMRMTYTDAERLIFFMIVAVLTAGLARKRSQAETRAREMRDRMAAIVESTEDAVLSATTNGTITSWNAGAQALYGYTEQEALGRHVAFLSSIERARDVSKNLARVRRGDPIKNYEVEHLRKDGSRVLVQLSVSPLRDGKTVIGASTIIRDITAEKRAAEALRKNEKLATAGRMAATIAHEINNPLEALANLLYLARGNPAKREEYLKLAEKEVDRVSAITRFALGFARESHTTTFIHVPEMMDEILSLYSGKISSAHVEVEKDYNAVTNIQGYSGELRQLFANLMINAVDAMKRGGRLRIRVARGREWSGAGRRGIHITIADDGTGIRKTEIPHLFEPFYTTKKDTGTGLGLWISQGIVQKHSGSIRVRSSVAPGKSGTVFRVFLPDTVTTQQAVA
jgi:PAS domain S-box-containing protein